MSSMPSPNAPEAPRTSSTTAAKRNRQSRERRRVILRNESAGSAAKVKRAVGVTQRALAREGPEAAQAAARAGVRPLAVEELLVFGRALERGRRSVAFDCRRHLIEVARADLALVLDGGEALFRGGELGLLQLHEGAHAVLRIAL